MLVCVRRFEVLVIIPALTLDVTPPPTKYDTVIVVFEGGSPYALVYKKLEGSKAKSKSDLLSLTPKPILSGFGMISSSAPLLIPAPNWIWRILFDVYLVTNLLGTF